MTPAWHIHGKEQIGSIRDIIRTKMHKSTYLYQNLKPKTRLWFLGLSLLLASVILVKSLGPAPSLGSISHIDKIAHAFAYFCLAIAAFPMLGRQRPLFVWAILSLGGAAVELLQGWMNLGRKADLLDAAANSFGVFVAFLLLWAISRFWR